MDRLSALKLVFQILIDKRNQNQYATVSLRNLKTGEVKATYDDAINVIEDAIAAEIEKRKSEGEEG